LSKAEYPTSVAFCTYAVCSSIKHVSLRLCIALEK
jgi:hypothetical protein